MADLELERMTDALLASSRALVAVAARSVAEAAEEVTLPQFRTLVVLRSRGPSTLLGLAGELDVAPSTASRMCDRLVRKGLIDRTIPEGNRREVQLVLTKRGEALVDSVLRRRRAQIRRIVQRIDPGQRRALVDALEAFAEAGGERVEATLQLDWR